MLAGLEAGKRDGMMQMMRQQNVNSIDVGQSVGVVCKRSRLCDFRNALGAGFVDIRGPDDVDAIVELTQRVQVEVRKPPAPDNADSMFTGQFRPTWYINLVPEAGLEPTTNSLGNYCSILLSYPGTKAKVNVLWCTPQPRRRADGESELIRDRQPA